MSELLELDDVLESEPPAASRRRSGDILHGVSSCQDPCERYRASGRCGISGWIYIAGPYLLKITMQLKIRRSQTCRPRPWHWT